MSYRPRKERQPRYCPEEILYERVQSILMFWFFTTLLLWLIFIFKKCKDNSFILKICVKDLVIFTCNLYLIIYIYQVWFPRILRKLITIHSFIESDRTKIYPIQFLKVYWLVETFGNVDFWLHEVIISMLDSNSHKNDLAVSFI